MDLRYTAVQRGQLQEMSDTVAGMHQRLDSLYQTMMTTMSIVESDRAIREAEEVNKLTSLAFFFIPLSFSSSVCGMNIVVCAARP